MNLEIIDKFKKYYADPMLFDVSFMDEFCDPDFKYEDPIVKIEGLETFKDFCTKLGGSLSRISMNYTHQSILHDKAFLSWECEVDFRLSQNKIRVSGITVLVVTDKIIRQRSYYDGGAFLYEPLPVIGPLLRWLRRVLTSQQP